MTISFSNRPFKRGFSMVEMMACVSIIGIIAFLAIPSITRMRSESERNLAIARAESLNLAQATFIQVRGRAQAGLDWTNAGTPDGKYALLRPYLSFSEASLGAYLPSQYTVTFPNQLGTMTKVSLFAPGNVAIPY